MTDQLFERLPFDKLMIENSGRDWPTYHQQILKALALPAKV
jgi:hypothetical protein